MSYTGSFTLSFKNEHIIYENEVRCLVKESDYNLSYNPTLLSGSYISGSVKDFATGSLLPSGSVSGSTSGYFRPYATAIGLYNDNNELLAVAKMSRPLTKDFTKEALIRVKIDY